MAFFDSVGATAGSGDRAAAVARAHARLLSDKSLQFDYHTLRPPQPPQVHPPPPWLKAIAAVLDALAPMMLYILYGGLILAAVLVAAFIVREIMRQRYPGWFKPKTFKQAPAKAPEWRPDLVKARVLLEDADRLAAEGRYAEAAHLLLFRTVEDIDGRRPNLVRPALTSRDIAALAALPEMARRAFEIIAQVVERSFFGGRPVDAGAFAECRRAYEAFIAPEAWA